MDDDFEIARSIFYSLTDGADMTDLPTHRTAKLLALLCQHLVEKKIIPEGTIDALMEEALRFK